MRATTQKIMLALILLTGSGCSRPRSQSAGPLPIYREPDPVTFSDEDKAILTEFSIAHQDLFKRIQGQEHAYRAIVREHNRRALEQNQQLLKSMGFDPALIRGDLVSPNPGASKTGDGGDGGNFPAPAKGDSK